MMNDNGCVKIKGAAGNVIFSLLALWVLSGCSYFQEKQDVRPAQILAMDGMDSYEEGDYKESLKLFREMILNWLLISLSEPLRKRQLIVKIRKPSVHLIV